MNQQELNVLYNLNKSISPNIDVNGNWVHIRNAKTATRSIETILRKTMVVRRRQYNKWNRVWNNKILTNKDNVFWFTFVRNPWDRCLSSFFHCQQSTARNHKIDANITFDDYLLNKVLKTGGMHNVHWYPQHLTITYNNKLLHNMFVGRFESLQNDWKYIASVLNIASGLPHIGKTLHRDYRTYYTKKTIDAVAEIYKQDIKLLGYTFK